MKRVAIVVGIIVVLLGVGVLLTKGSSPSTPLSPGANTGTGNNSQQTTTTISMADLQAANGKNGQRCWVAIDGTVYQIDQGFQWQNGEHRPSGGRAYCGADLSNVIDQAPHGRTVLAQLQIVGKLSN